MQEPACKGSWVSSIRELRRCRRSAALVGQQELLLQARPWYRAFVGPFDVEGRSDKDPSEFWYQGEIGFYDFYIIPLAKKLKDCGVFGVSSDEYLNYAMKNRQEWASRGLEVVAGLVEDTKAKLLAEKNAAE
jgi:hypothetical protein